MQCSEKIFERFSSIFHEHRQAFGQNNDRILLIRQTNKQHWIHLFKIRRIFDSNTIICVLLDPFIEVFIPAKQDSLLFLPYRSTQAIYCSILLFPSIYSCEASNSSLCYFFDYKFSPEPILIDLTFFNRYLLE